MNNTNDPDAENNNPNPESEKQFTPLVDPPKPPPIPERAKPAFAPATPAIDRFTAAPLSGKVNLVTVLEGILKFPGRVLYELRAGRAGAAAFALGILLVFCLAVYGVVVGSLSGNAQLWIAPAKILVGSLVCALICLPSLYIFLCLGGADTSLKQVAGELLAAVSLTALLLIGFAPVAWVFSQSTDSVALMASLHLLFWVIALWFGLRLIGRGMASGSRGDVKVWIFIYVLVCLQMMTALRPIVGTADTILPKQKQFFLAHFSQLLSEGESSAPQR